MASRQRPQTGSRGANTKSQGKLFISYRRSDSAAIAGRIRDWLTQRLPVDKVFFDVETIEYGADFERRIEQTIPQSRAVLAIIGPNWLEPQGGPSHFIQLETELALRHGVPIVPVLVEGASMPTAAQLPQSLQELPKFNAAQVRSGHDFSHDMEELAAVLKIPVKPRSQPAMSSPRFWLITAIALAVLAVGVIGVFGVDKLLSSTQQNLTAAHRSQTAAAQDQEATAQGQASATASAVAATAGASQNATATAIALAPFTHIAAAPGPDCDPSGQWSLQEGSSTGVSVTCQANSTQVTGGPNNPVFLTFTGANNFTFSVPFTVSVDVSNMQDSCATLFVSYGQVSSPLLAHSYHLQVCAEGLWQVTNTAPGVRLSGPLPGEGPVTQTIASTATPNAPVVPNAATFHFSISDDGYEVYFMVGTTTVAMVPVANLQPSYHPLSFGIGIDEGTSTFAKFSVVPHA